MKRPLLALLVAAVVVLVAALVFQLSRDPAADAATGPSSTAVAPAHSVGAADSGALARSSGPADLVAPESAALERAEAPRDSSTGGTRLRIEGRVEAPPGCAPDATAEVLALSVASGIDGALRLLEFGTPRRAPGQNPFGPDAPVTAVSGEGAVLGRAPIGADGRYRLDVVSSGFRAHLLVVGRSWHGRETRPIEIGAEHADAPARLDLVAACGAWIEGVASTPPGRDEDDVNGVVVTLETSAESVTGDARTFRATRRETRVGSGRFEFRALDPAQVYDLSATPERLASAKTQARDLAPGRGTAVELAFPLGGAARGVVLDEAGTPVAGATVRATKAGRWFGFDDRTVRSAETGADGRFELVAVAAGPTEIVGEAAGRLLEKSVKSEIVDGGLVEGLTLILGSGGTISGVVRWADGTPGAGLTVEVSFDMSQMAGMGAFNARKGARGSARADESGRFRASGLGPGPFVVEVRALPASEAAALAEADAPTRREHEHRARVALVKPGTEGLELVLRPPTGVRGRVVDVTGEPVPGFIVHAGAVGEGLLAELGQEQKDLPVSHPQGEFRISGLHDGKWKLHVASAGFSRSTPVELVLPLPESEPPLVVVLERAAAVRGQVKAPDGRPVAGATVYVDDGGPEWARAISSTKAPEAKSGDGGSFELDGLKAGAFVLRARHEDHASSAPLALDLAPGAVLEGVALALTLGGRITGEVYHEGQPAPGMMIQIQDMKTFSQRVTTSGADGRFAAAHLDPGKYQVIAMPATGGSMVSEEGDFDPSAMLANLKMTTADVVEGSDVHVVLGAPPEDPVQVTGRVTMAGAPVAGAMVMFLPEGGKKGLAGFKPATTKKDGTYAITLDGPGPYSVSVQRVSAQMTDQSLHEERHVMPKAPQHTLDVVLPEGRISGRVLGADGGPAAGARVSVVREGVGRPGTLWGGQFHELRTDSEGAYDATGLSSGTYTLMVGGTELGGMLGDASTASGGREIRGGISLGEREWRRGVDFRLKAPATVEVSVVDESGKSVAGAIVFARDEHGLPVDVFSFVTTDATGSAKYAGLAAGRYTFRARTDTITSAESAAVRVDTGEKAAVKLVLERGTVLVVKIVDGAKSPLPASVEVLDEHGRNVGAQFGLAELMERFQGGGFDPAEQRFGPIPPGKYKVRVTSEAGKSTTKTVSLTGQPERRLTVELD